MSLSVQGTQGQPVGKEDEQIVRQDSKSCLNRGSTPDKTRCLGSVPKGPHHSCRHCPHSLGPEALPLCGYPLTGTHACSKPLLWAPFLAAHGAAPNSAGEATTQDLARSCGECPQGETRTCPRCRDLMARGPPVGLGLRTPAPRPPLTLAPPAHRTSFTPGCFGFWLQRSAQFPSPAQAGFPSPCQPGAPFPIGCRPALPPARGGPGCKVHIGQGWEGTSPVGDGPGRGVFQPLHLGDPIKPRAECTSAPLCTTR